MAKWDDEIVSPLMCSCALTFRPVLLSMSTLNDCDLCGGAGWVEEHEFTGDEDECTVCGWNKVGHWKP